ncbi:phage shock protein A [Bacillus ectoiniformans]|uniref:PspA/IM30 family protein n=1 Tax=Bacillus ectoiniformans TaxID=1494429 RepID=UPI0019587BC1|nr:PspA/IM30 family protein [Bacillus ectoiniformans]MBM7649442.1 phage shock protein A [Bacillus ectoiniformans]
MSGIFSKVRSAVEAELFEFVEVKEKKNPLALLNQYVREAEKETAKVTKLIQRQQLLQKEFQREWVQADEQARKRSRQASLAAAAGEAELQEFAEHEAKVYRDRADRLQHSIDIAREQLVSLEKKGEDMQHKLKDMQVRRLQLMGRENVVRANNSLNKLIDSAESEKPFGRFEELEEYIDRLEGRLQERYESSLMEERLAQLERTMAPKEKSAPEE